MDTAAMNQIQQEHRKALVDNTRALILNRIHAEELGEDFIVFPYRGFYLQITFTVLHPLMSFCLARNLPKQGTEGCMQVINDLNRRSILGCHTIHDEAGCYAYRATHWLETEYSAARFFEILDRCVDEAEYGYHIIKNTDSN